MKLYRPMPATFDGRVQGELFGGLPFGDVLADSDRVGSPRIDDPDAGRPVVALETGVDEMAFLPESQPFDEDGDPRPL